MLAEKNKWNDISEYFRKFKKFIETSNFAACHIENIKKVYDVKQVEKGYAKYPLANQKRIDDYWPLLQTLFKKYHK